MTSQALLSVRSDKRRFPPFGLEGGRPGSPSLNLIDPGTPGERLLPVLMEKPVRLTRGMVFRHVLAGGGGYGPPEARDPAAVLDDVRTGVVSPGGALRDYGVAVVATADGGWEVDAGATARSRAAMRGAR